MSKKDLLQRFRSHRGLLLVAALSALVGALNLTAPLELLLTCVGVTINPQKASQSIEVVGIDREASLTGGKASWNAEDLANLNQALFNAGAARVFYTVPIDGNPEQLTRLAGNFAQHSGRVFTTARIESRRGASTPNLILPPPQIAEVAPVLSNSHFIEFWGGARRASYSLSIGKRLLTSTEAMLAGVRGKPAETFPINYRIRVSDLPYQSAAVILRSAPGAGLLGKDVIVGLNDASAPKRSIIGQGPASEVFLTALAAETLKRARPVDLGWLPLWLAAMGICAAVLSRRQARFALTVLGLSSLAVIAAPLILEASQIFMLFTPALAALIGAAVIVAWRRFGARQRIGGTINPYSGLQTVNTLRVEERTDSRQLICARIRRYADVVTAMPHANEVQFVKRIVERLQLGCMGAPLIHGDEGNFFFLSPIYDHDMLIEQFMAMHVIFRAPIPVGRAKYDVDISFGIDRQYHLPVSHRTLTALAAAHEAEEDGTRWRIHDPAKADEKAWSLSMLGELDEALQQNQIWVAYQPKLDLASGAVIGAEALVRWTHETRGPISPAQFVEMAEKHGRIDSLTRFVLNDAVKTLVTLLPLSPDFRMAVNLSPVLFRSRDIVETVRCALDAYNVPASALILEVTETFSMGVGEAPAHIMDAFTALGVGLSIDDYGTGMSTLEYLQRIPASELKIDRRFVKDVLTNERDRAVLASTIQLAHALGMKAVAEGIEDAEALALVTQLGCDTGQGYYIGRPLEAKILFSRIAAQTGAEQIRDGISAFG